MNPGARMENRIDFLMNYTRFQDEQKAFEKFSKLLQI